MRGLAASCAYSMVKPFLKKESVINRTIGDFVERLFGGDPVPMLQHLAKHGKITKEDVKDLNKLINKK